MLIERGSDARYAPTGHLIYLHGGTIFVVALDVSSLEVSAGSVPLIENVMPWSPSNFSFSDSGALLFLPNRAAATTLMRFTFDAAADGAPLWTPDGKRIIFRSDRDGGGIFWKR